MERIYIQELNKHFNQEIELQGFIESIRDLQWVQFIVLKDITGKVQLTVEKNEENKKLNEIVSGLTLDSTILILGKVTENEKVKLNGMEVIPTTIEITSLADPNIPINYKNPESSHRETRLDWRYIDLRSDKNNLLFRCQTEIIRAMREWWNNNNFIEINSPKIAGASAEGGSTVFYLDYFGQEACLSQSPQLYKQMAMASNFDKVFEIGQAYRAEESHTSYHSAEILMVDMEISFIKSFHDVLDIEEAWLKHVFKSLKDKYGDEIKKEFNVELNNIDYEFPRITFEECKQILKDKYNYIGENTEDFDRKEEELIGEYTTEKYNSEFVFVINYPYSSRPFYSMKCSDNPKLTETFDLLYKGIEVTSGAQREHRYDILKSQITEKGINPELMEDYLNFFKYGMPPHGGLGFGMGRLLMRIFDIDNIREATFLYRGPNRLTP